MLDESNSLSFKTCLVRVKGKMLFSIDIVRPSENTANQIMPKKVSVLKQVRLTDENHSALIKVKTQAIMPTSLGSLANCAITIALPQLQERFCKPITKG